jgi:hypothetical protein
MNFLRRVVCGFVITSPVWFLIWSFPELIRAHPSEINQDNYKVKIILNIGSDETSGQKEDSYQFYTIDGVNLDREGSIYVLDKKAVCIKVFDKHGKFLRRMFKRGKGPDEISNVARFTINPYNGNIFVLQDFGYTMKEFEPSGNFVKLHRLPEQFFNYFEFIDKDRLIFTTFGIRNDGNKERDFNFKILNLSSSKIEQAFAPTSTESALRNSQGFTIYENQLWTCPGDKMELAAYHLNTFEQTRKIPIPGTYKKNRINVFTRYGAKGLQPIYFSLAHPFTLGKQLFVLVTIQDYIIRDDKSMASPERSQLTLYLLNGKSLKKLIDLECCGSMTLGDVFDNRMVLFANDPYPRVTVLEISSVMSRLK